MSSRARRASAKVLDRLVRAAADARANAYAPYSNYAVGAAIATRSGGVYTGCNVENASYGATICAERGAIMQMVAAGDRDPIACAVVTSDEGSPCGMCRQVLVEFAPDMAVVLVAAEGSGATGAKKKRGAASRRTVRLRDLIPEAFRFPTRGAS